MLMPDNISNKLNAIRGRISEIIFLRFTYKSCITTLGTNRYPENNNGITKHQISNK